MNFDQRTVNCGALRASDAGKTVVLNGWVHRDRNHGALHFINLRDRYGITQITFDETMAEQIKDVRNEFVIEVEGTVQEKAEPNKKLATGDIEVLVDKCTTLSEAKTTPMLIQDETDALEDIRLQHRYLDLRRDVVRNKIILHVG